MNWGLHISQSHVSENHSGFLPHHFQGVISNHPIICQFHTTARIEKAVFNKLPSPTPTSHNNHLL